MSKVDDERLNEARLALASSFSPRGPINNQDLFAGRQEQMFQIVEVLNSFNEHGVIYGERGVGKTSLAVVAGAYAFLRGHFSLRVNCDSSDDFQSLWTKVGQTIELESAQYLQDGDKEASITEERFDDAAQTLMVGENQPGDVLMVLRRISDAHPLIVFDEFDVLRGDQPTTQKLGDLLKGLSDHGIRATLLIVGVADSVEEIVGSHESVGRSLRQVAMPRMSPDELEAILDKGFGAAGITIDAQPKEQIIYLSQGMPHYTHLLGQQAGIAACLGGQLHVEGEHVSSAIEGAISSAQESIRQAYVRAITSPQENNLFPVVLLAAALAISDERGFFRPADLSSPMEKLLGAPVHQSKYNGHLPRLADNRGHVLERTGSERRWRYRFREPLMRPYILMRGLQEGRITVEDIPAY